MVIGHTPSTLRGIIWCRPLRKAHLSRGRIVALLRWRRRRRRVVEQGGGAGSKWSVCKRRFEAGHLWRGELRARTERINVMLRRCNVKNNNNRKNCIQFAGSCDVTSERHLGQKSEMSTLRASKILQNAYIHTNAKIMDE